MVGCAECYRTFGARLQQLLGHSSRPLQHDGRYPQRLQTYKKMFVDKEVFREQLREAVEREEYEQAAVLRDKINSIDGSGGESG
jgi:protein arginine kinase activator